MTPDPSLQRYRRWYARLLRLYPRPFRERFGPSLEQTFTDLSRERRRSAWELHLFALQTFAETFAAILRENLMSTTRAKLFRWTLVTAAVLLVPLLAVLFDWSVPDPGSSQLEGVAWGPFDFVVAGLLVFGAGMAYEVATRRARHPAHRLAVGIAVGSALLLVWGNLAAGMIGDERNPANLMYGGVLAVALIGAAVAQLRPWGMAGAMLATAVAQALVALIAVIAGLPAALPLDVVFVALWLASAVLFRQAAVAPASAGKPR